MKITDMKKQILTLFAALLAFTACGADSRHSYTVEVPLTADADNSMAYLTDWDSGEKTDSVIVTGGKAVFTGNATTPYIARVIVNGKRGPIFIVEPGSVKLDAQGNSSGTLLNDRLTAGVKRMEELRTAASALNPADSIQADSLRRLSARYDAMPTQLYKENIGNLAGLYWFLQSAYEMNLDQLDAAVKEDPNLSASKRVQNLRNALLAAAQTSVGKHYKDFTVTYDGKTQKLSDFVKPGTYTLVDFWASWCRPCLRALKTIKELYGKYHDRGLNVVGVAVWDEPQNTLAAIKTHQLPWPCIIDAQSIPTDLYGIPGIPCIILINPEGIIVSRDKQGDELIADVEKAMEGFTPAAPASEVAPTDSVK